MDVHSGSIRGNPRHDPASGPVQRRRFTPLYRCLAPKLYTCRSQARRKGHLENARNCLMILNVPSHPRNSFQPKRVRMPAR
jgi:hypothetical protein